MSFGVNMILLGQISQEDVIAHLWCGEWPGGGVSCMCGNEKVNSNSRSEADETKKTAREQTFLQKLDSCARPYFTVNSLTLMAHWAAGRGVARGKKVNGSLKHWGMVGVPQKLWPSGFKFRASDWNFRYLNRPVLNLIYERLGLLEGSLENEHNLTHSTNSIKMWANVAWGYCLNPQRFWVDTFLTRFLTRLPHSSELSAAWSLSCIPCNQAERCIPVGPDRDHCGAISVFHAAGGRGRSDRQPFKSSRFSKRLSFCCFYCIKSTSVALFIKANSRWLSALILLCTNSSDSSHTLLLIIYPVA